MKKTLKENRLLRQLSQQELSQLSGVSIRTIQRIEKNLSAGSPYVVKSICQALGISLESLELPVTNKDHNEKKEINGDEKACVKSLKFINFSSLMILLVPFSNLVIPAVVYFFRRKSLTDMSYQQAALKMISFQILWSAFTLLLIIFVPLLVKLLSGTENLMDVPVFIWIYLILLAIHITVTFTIAIKLNKSNEIPAFIPNIL